MTTCEEIGHRIRERRNLLGITQADLAEIAGVSLRSLLAIERGQANPSLLQLLKILDTLGLTVRVHDKPTG